MTSKCEEVNINGIKYIREDVKDSKELCDDKYVIVRTYSAGVHAGYMKNRKGKEVILERARRLWYWKGAASLSQLSVDGVANPDECKFPCEVAEITLTEAIEIIPCTKKAKKSIAEVPVWKK